jgi:hypothetical protein
MLLVSEPCANGSSTTLSQIATASNLCGGYPTSDPAIVGIRLPGPLPADFRCLVPKPFVQYRRIVLMVRGAQFSNRRRHHIATGDVILIFGTAYDQLHAHPLALAFKTLDYEVNQQPA